MSEEKDSGQGALRAATPRRGRQKIGDMQIIGGIRVVCVPDYLLTRVGMDPGTMGVVLTPEAADSLITAMRDAGLIPTDTASPASPLGPDNEDG